MTTAEPRPAAGPARGSTRGRIGGALLAAGAVQFLLAHLVVQSAWTRPSYSWWDDYISDLGAVGCGPLLGNDVCSPWHAAMNASFAVQGVLLAAGATLATAAWARSAGLRVWTVMMWLVGASWMAIGSIPEDVSLTGHSLGALPIFVLGNVALLVAASSRFTRAFPVVRASALVLGIAGLLGIALMTTAGPHGPVGIGLAERLVVFPLQIWAIITGLTLALRPVRTVADRRARSTS